MRVRAILHYFCCALMMSALLSGCSYYKTPDLSESEGAMIHYVDPLAIVSIDGQQILTLPALVEDFKCILVTPGKHDIRARHIAAYGTLIVRSEVTLWFVAQAGGKYGLCHSEEEGRLKSIWIEDKETFRRVGGIKGSDDEPAADTQP